MPIPIRRALIRLASIVSLTALAIGALGGAARADRHVYLNGVMIDGVRDQRLENCVVRIDSKGDLYIEAKGYAVKVADPPSASQPAATATTAAAPLPTATASVPPASGTPITPPPASHPISAAAAPPTSSATTPLPIAPAGPPVPMTLARHYWLAALQPGHPGATQYDVDVYVNGTWVARIRSSDRTFVPLDVTKFVRPGSDTVHFVALKNLGGGARLSQSPTDQLEIVIGEGSVAGGKLTIDQVDADFVRNATEMDPETRDYPFNGR